VNALQYAQQVSEISDAGINRFGVLRVARVMRVFRLMRFVELLRFYRVIKAHMMNKELSPEVAERLQKVTILTNYVKAHAKSQKNAIGFFGSSSMTDVVELAHTILQSQISCFKAILLAVRLQSMLDEIMLKEVNEMKLRKKVAEDLEHFVSEAHHLGIVSAKEAEGMLHPLHDMIKACNTKVKHAHFGFVSVSPGESVGDLEM